MFQNVYDVILKKFQEQNRKYILKLNEIEVKFQKIISEQDYKGFVSIVNTKKDPAVNMETQTEDVKKQLLGKKSSSA